MIDATTEERVTSSAVSSLAAGRIADDDRFIALVMIVAMIVIPRLARRFVPALRPDAR